MIRFLLLTLLAALAACAAPPAGPALTQTFLPSTTDEARQVLMKFFELLNAQDYAEADALYGGSYETFQGWNPDVDPDDHVMLWTRACRQNGLQCLLARTITFRQLQGGTYIFQVEFSNPHGSLFVLGPCCGADATEMPPVSQFEYTVTRNADGKFLVMEPPPYVP